MTPAIDVRPVEPDIFAHGGEMGELMREFDWSRTAIGPPEKWSQALKTTVRILLANRFPLLLWWGSDYISLYNDAYRPILGKKHPWGLGKPLRECWAEVADTLMPLIDRPFYGGPATWSEDLELEIHRSGFAEETHFTIAYSPVPDETAQGGIGGVLATVHEITEKVVGQRRVAVLRDLSARASDARNPEEACAIAAHTLAMHARDIPFALLYVVEAGGKQVRIAGLSGMEHGNALAPEVVNLDESGRQEPWGLAGMRAGGATGIVDAPRRAAVLPIRSNTADGVAGFLIAGLSGSLRFDDAYSSFLQLVCSQIATAMANARAYEEGRRRAEALAELDRAKTAFFANVSHEFRTPLTLMLGPLESLLTSEGMTDRERDQLDTAYRNSLRLLRLVNSLLDFSSIEAGRANARYTPVDLAALTENLASNFRSAMEAARLNFAVDCAPLPEPVYVDCDMWEKIVLNLLSNAFKFTLRGKVSLGLEASGGQAVLTVADTGTGIAESAMPHIFERFYRAEGAGGRSYEGTGIGLALVRELVRLHGGTIDAVSREGEGSRFQVSIPFGSGHLPEQQVGAARKGGANAPQAMAFAAIAQNRAPRETLTDDEPEAAHARGGNRPAVLIADDNADMREHLKAILGRRCEVRVFGDGRAALEAAKRSTPDLILSDVMMPRSDGFELLREIRSDPMLREVPVLLLSARAGEEARTDGIAAGADDYITKPFSARELLARVNTAIELQRVRRGAREAIEALNDELRCANEDLEQFAYSVSHDLQEPLRGVKIFSELLEQRLSGRLDEQDTEYLEYLRSGASRLEVLVKDLLCYTQARHVEKPDKSEPAADAFSAALANLEIAIQESGAAVACGELPAVCMRSSHLQLVFQNLIGNAIKYRRPGVKPEVSVAARRRNDQSGNDRSGNDRSGNDRSGNDQSGNDEWIFSVRDNGIGIEREFRERIFGLFKRLHRNDSCGGSGVGLAICKRIVERYAGAIWVESQPGEGSTFYFTLRA